MNQNQNDKTLGVLPLAMFAVGTTLASGVFSLSGDFAAGGAHTLATLIGWAICGIGMFGLTMCFFKLSIVKKDLTIGIYTYARSGFGEYIGFNAAWGYWMSAILAQLAFITLFFETLGHYAVAFGNGTNLASCALASVIIWALSLLVLRGVNQAVVVNVVIVIAKIVPILSVVVAIMLGGAFSWDIFTQNFAGTGEMSLLEQVKSTVYVTVWIFIGIEGAVVISGRGRTTKISGQATIISFTSLFLLYFLISFLSMGVLPAEELAALANPSLGGVLEYVVGPWGATLVHIALLISVGGAMFSYTILCVDSAFGPAAYGAFPEVLSRKNKLGAPTWSVIASALIVQLFIVIIYFNDATFQMCYALSTSAIMVPYVFSAFYYFKIVYRGEDREIEKGSRVAPWIIAIIGAFYGVWLLYASGLTYILAMTILYAPGTIMYLYHRQKTGQRYFDKASDMAICAILVALAVLALILTVKGTIVWF